MSFCPICKRNHDPDIYCTDGTRQILRDMGIEKRSSKTSPEELRKLNRKAVTFLVVFAVIMVFLAFYFTIRSFWL